MKISTKQIKVRLFFCVLGSLKEGSMSEWPLFTAHDFALRMSANKMGLILQIQTCHHARSTNFVEDVCWRKAVSCLTIFSPYVLIGFLKDIDRSKPFYEYIWRKIKEKRLRQTKTKQNEKSVRTFHSLARIEKTLRGNKNECLAPSSWHEC